MSRLRYGALCHFCDRHLAIVMANVGDEKGRACMLRLDCDPDPEGNVRMGPNGRAILLNPVQAQQERERGATLYRQHECIVFRRAVA